MNVISVFVFVVGGKTVTVSRELFGVGVGGGCWRGGGFVAKYRYDSCSVRVVAP